MNPDASSWNISKPCTAKWDSMPGDDKQRFCEQCQKHVHNVSALTQEERVELAKPDGKEKCIAYFRNQDGTPADLSFLAALRRRIPWLRFASWSMLAAMLPGLTGCFVGKKCDEPPFPPPRQTTNTLGSAQSTNQTIAPKTPEKAKAP